MQLLDNPYPSLLLYRNLSAPKLIRYPNCISILYGHLKGLPQDNMSATTLRGSDILALFYAKEELFVLRRQLHLI